MINGILKKEKQGRESWVGEVVGEHRQCGSTKLGVSTGASLRRWHLNQDLEVVRGSLEQTPGITVFQAGKSPRQESTWYA